MPVRRGAGASEHAPPANSRTRVYPLQGRPVRLPSARAARLRCTRGRSAAASGRWSRQGNNTKEWRLAFNLRGNGRCTRALSATASGPLSRSAGTWSRRRARTGPRPRSRRGGGSGVRCARRRATSGGRGGWAWSSWAMSATRPRASAAASRAAAQRQQARASRPGSLTRAETWVRYKFEQQLKSWSGSLVRQAEQRRERNPWSGSHIRQAERRRERNPWSGSHVRQAEMSGKQSGDESGTLVRQSCQASRAELVWRSLFGAAS